MDMMHILFNYVFPSLAVIAIMALLIVLAVLKTMPTAWTLLIKKLGLAPKGKGYILKSYDDLYASVEKVDVYPEGAMEKKAKKGRITETYYLPKVQDTTDNTIENMQANIRDRVMLTPINIDGVLPVYCCHVSKAIATTPAALASLRNADMLNSSGELEVMPEKPAKNPQDGQPQEPILVKLWYSFSDIKKHFAAYWTQATIDSTKKRHQNIGYEKAKKEYKEYIWPLVIVGVVVIAGMIITGLALKLF